MSLVKKSTSEVPDWTESILSVILSRMPAKLSKQLFTAAARRGRHLAEQVAGPLTGLNALAVTEHDKLMGLFHAKRWRQPTDAEWRALVEICAIYALNPWGQRIGDRVLYLSSRFTKPKRKLKLRTGKRGKKVRLKLKRS